MSERCQNSSLECVGLNSPTLKAGVSKERERDLDISLGDGRFLCCDPRAHVLLS